MVGQGPWPGRAEPWGAGAWVCSGLTGEGADVGTRAWAGGGAPEGCQRAVRAGGAFRTLRTWCSYRGEDQCEGCGCEVETFMLDTTEWRKPGTCVLSFLLRHEVLVFTRSTVFT